MQQTFKKVVATTLGLALILTMILFIMPVQTANADSVVWEKVDYDRYFNYEYYEGTDAYGGNIKDLGLPSNYRYLYIFLSGAGGMGGASIDTNPGYGGGSGGLIVAKIDLRKTESIIILLGKGGGKFAFGSSDTQEDGDGYPSSIWALKGYTETTPTLLDIVGCYGGKHATYETPGAGGIVESATKNNLISVVYSQNGADGGQASHSFSVDLGFRTEHFIYRPMGAYPSGKGGGASVYHRGGDGGVMYKNGSDGVMGAGGGGAGKGATQGGFGGDAYMEIYGSNM